MISGIAYKFKIVESEGSNLHAEIFSGLGALRFVWNCAHAQRQMAYRNLRNHGVLTDKFLQVKMTKAEKEKASEFNSKFRVTYNSQTEEIKLKEINNLESFPEFKDISFVGRIPSQCVQQKLKDLDSAFSKFFKGKSGFPQLKRAKEKSDSMRFPEPKHIKLEPTKRVKISRHGHSRVKGFGYVTVPKYGRLKFLQTREMKFDKVNSVTISQDGKDLYVSFSCEVDLNLERGSSHESVGVDRNANGEATLALSNGELVAGPLSDLVMIENRISFLQARLRRMKKGSKNKRKAYNKISKLHVKKARILKNWQHNVTSKIAKNHSCLAFENLLLKNMTASAAGTLEEPGQNVAAKSGLNKSMLRFGHGEILRQILYKVSWRKGRVFVVNPHYTSKTCSVCESKNTLRDERHFECHSCGIILDADVNAATNIKARLENFLKSGKDIPGVSVELLPSVCDAYVANKAKRGSRNLLRAEKRKLLESSKPSAA